MPSQELDRIVEPFRDTTYPFLYWIDDRMLMDTVIQHVSAQPFGIEIGHGGIPAKIYNIDQKLPWLLVEPDDSIPKNYVELAWGRVPPLRSQCKAYAIRTYARPDLVLQARVIVARNLDYRHMEFPHISQLSRGQRVVFLVDHMSAADETPRYKDFLENHGYSWGDVQKISGGTDFGWTPSSNSNPIKTLLLDYTR